MEAMRAERRRDEKINGIVYDMEEACYNARTEICLRAFPHIKMILEDIFEGIE